MYPGYFGRRDLSSDNLRAYVAQSVAVLAPKLEREMEHCLCYGREREGARERDGGGERDAGREREAGRPNSANVPRERASWPAFFSSDCPRSALC